ncbi:hypothetical protein HZC21_05695 [Candidatus Peregrinibacteria bacterium]|nr:hypothetical protein [Candidatus Peregrinibacteria bacterium]
MNTPSDSDNLGKLLEEATGAQPIFTDKDDLFDRAKMEEAVSQAVEKARAKIHGIFDKLPDDLKTVITHIATQEDADVHDVAAEWLTQRMLLTEIGRNFGLKNVNSMPADSPEGFLVLTRSSSIISGSQLHDGTRDIEYIRIPSRRKSWSKPTTFRGNPSDIQTERQMYIHGHFTTAPVDIILVFPETQIALREKITRATVDSVMTAARVIVPPRK